MILVLPLPPNYSNDGRVHWRRKHNAQQTYFANLDMLQQLATLDVFVVPGPPRVRPERVRLSAHLYVWAHMDDDNAMARLKWPVDWLKTRGYVADDKRANIEWAGLPAQTVDRKAPRLELTLEPVG